MFISLNMIILIKKALIRALLLVFVVFLLAQNKSLYQLFLSRFEPNLVNARRIG
jgi:hypothetical protein